MTYSLAINTHSEPLPRVSAILFALAFLAVSAAEAVTPAPDGGYPNANTAEGDTALESLTTGINNTAIGFAALSANKNGSFNTATGSQALLNNSGGSANTALGAQALVSNSSGDSNSATGYQA